MSIFFLSFFFSSFRFLSTVVSRVVASLSVSEGQCLLSRYNKSTGSEIIEASKQQQKKRTRKKGVLSFSEK